MSSSDIKQKNTASPFGFGNTKLSPFTSVVKAKTEEKTGDNPEEKPKD